MDKKKIYIKTYGCAMNVYDSARMNDLMAPYGYEEVNDPKDANLTILNTCHIREKAEEKLYSDLGRIRKLKDKKLNNNEESIIVVAGCVGQAEGEIIFKRAPYVDIIVGPQSYQNLPDLIGNIKRQTMKDKGHNIINLDFEIDKFDKLSPTSTSQGISAVLSVQEGCDKFCTFCVVPYTRGAEYSREVSKIYREAIAMVESGSKEITLLGQNVNAYHGTAIDDKTYNLGQLITHISKIKGLERIRYSTSHPRDMHEDLYIAHRDIEQLMPFLNLPVQSGSNNILKAMNRKHSRDHYFKIIDRLRELRPNMQFSTDLIVGFPGETDQDFLDTIDLVKRVNYTQSYSFKYSPRPGTPGAQMQNQVEEHVKDERLQELQSIINAQQLQFNQDCVGQKMKVLFDKKGKFNGQLVGKSPYMQSVFIDNAPDEYLGQIIEVIIDQAKPNSLGAKIIDNNNQLYYG